MRGTGDSPGRGPSRTVSDNKDTGAQDDGGDFVPDHSVKCEAWKTYAATAVTIVDDGGEDAPRGRFPHSRGHVLF